MSVDFDKLTEVNAELRELEDDKRLTKAEFDRLYKQAEEAVGDDVDFLEGIRMRGYAWGFLAPDDD